MSQVELGLWCQIDTLGLNGRPALFLDRDGVVVADTHYLGHPKHLHMIEGAATAIAKCNALGIPIVIVTNQSGIGRGYYDWNGFRAVQAALCSALAAAGAKLDAVLACAYHGDAAEQFRIANHPWRKPNPGMILEAANRMNLDLFRSWIVGDRIGDIAAGHAAGLRGGILITPDHSGGPDALPFSNQDFSIDTAPDLASAVAMLLSHDQLSLLGPAQSS